VAIYDRSGHRVVLPYLQNRKGMWLPDEVWAIRQIWLERRGDDWEPVEAAAIAMMEQRRKTKKLDVRMIGFIIGIFLGYLTLILMLIITLAFSLFFLRGYSLESLLLYLSFPSASLSCAADVKGIRATPFRVVVFVGYKRVSIALSSARQGAGVGLSRHVERIARPVTISVSQRRSLWFCQ